MDIKYLGLQGLTYFKDILVKKENVLEKDNEIEYTPTSDYNPATKKYVDDKNGEKYDILDAKYTESRLETLLKDQVEIINGTVSTFIGYEDYYNDSDGTFYNLYFNSDKNLENYKEEEVFCQFKYKYNEKSYTCSFSGTIKFIEQYGCYYFSRVTEDFISQSDTNLVNLFFDFYLDKNYSFSNYEIIDSVGKCCFSFTLMNGNDNGDKKYSEEEFLSIVEILKNAEITIYAAKKNVLTLDNATEYIPTGDYNPVTKKYVDDSVSTATTGVVKYSEAQELTEEQKAQARNNIAKTVYDWYTTTKGYNCTLADYNPYYNLPITLDCEKADSIVSVTDSGFSALSAIAYLIYIFLADCLNKNGANIIADISMISSELDNLRNNGALTGDVLFLCYDNKYDEPAIGVILANKEITISGVKYTHNLNVINDDYNNTSGICYWNLDTQEYNNKIERKYVDDTLTQVNYYADAKAVGDKFTEVEGNIAVLDNEKTDILDTAYLESKTDGMYYNVNEIVSNIILNDYLIEVSEYTNETYPQLNSTSVICAIPQTNTLDAYNTFCFQIKGYYNNEAYTVSWNGVPSQFKALDLLISGEYVATIKGMIKPLSTWDIENNKWIDSEDTFAVDILIQTNTVQEGFVLEDLVESIKNAEFSFYATNKNFLPLNNTIEYTPTSDYNPATKKYVDDSVASVDVQSDWNQNDETAKDYIKNKPFYKMENPNPVLFEGDVTIETITSEDGSSYIAAKMPNFIVDNIMNSGSVYNITINETVFENQSFLYTTTTNSYSWYDNIVTVSYLIDYDPELNCYVFGTINATEGDVYTLKIEDTREYLYKFLDEEFLPKNLGRSATNSDTWVFGNSNNNEVDGGHGSLVSGRNHTLKSVSRSIVTGYGNRVETSMYDSVLAGNLNEIDGDFVSVFGRNLIGHNENQHLIGKFNIEDTTGNYRTEGKYVHIVGNGKSDDARSNAHTLDWSGNAWYQGDVYIGGTGQDDENAKKLATEEYAKSLIPTEAEALAICAEMGLIEPVTDDTSIFTDENGQVYIY